MKQVFFKVAKVFSSEETSFFCVNDNNLPNRLLESIDIVICIKRERDKRIA